MSEGTLIVLSGGLDSSVLAYKLKSEGQRIRAIYLDIGYRPRIAERHASKMLAFKLDFPLETVDVSGLFEMVSGFVPLELLGLGELDKGQPTPIPAAFDKDYVSGFQVVLSIATYYAMLAQLPFISTGIIRDQIIHNSGLLTFLHDWSDLVNRINPHRTVSLQTPFADMTKAEVIKLGASLNVDFSATWSCYNEAPFHCGVCPGCISRKQSFSATGIADLTSYKL